MGAFAPVSITPTMPVEPSCDHPGPPGPDGARVNTVNDIRARFDSLTARQREICLLVVGGLMNKKIAEVLGASINTVKTHRSEVFRKMKATSLLDLVRMMDIIKTVEGQPENSRDGMNGHPFGTDEVPASLRVIVVEDIASLRQSLIGGLIALGHQATGARNGDELDVAMVVTVPDIVLLDIGLGQGLEDGFAIATRLRRYPRCGIIMVTARGDVSSRIQGLDSGADAYMVKPIDFHELASVMKSVVRRLTIPQPSP